MWRRGVIVSNFDRSPWVIGRWRSVRPPSRLCCGLNASKTIPMARSFVATPILAKVECKGKVVRGLSKSSWEKMRIVQAWHCHDYETRCRDLIVTRDSHLHEVYARWRSGFRILDSQARRAAQRKFNRESKSIETRYQKLFVKQLCIPEKEIV